MDRSRIRYVLRHTHARALCSVCVHTHGNKNTTCMHENIQRELEEQLCYDLLLALVSRFEGMAGHAYSP